MRFGYLQGIRMIFRQIHGDRLPPETRGRMRDGINPYAQDRHRSCNQVAAGLDKLVRNPVNAQLLPSVRGDVFRRCPPPKLPAER